MQNTIVSTGYILPQSVISNGQTTGNAWTNPTNVLLVDGDVAQSDPGAGVASDIIIGNYNVNIPQNAVVTGITMKLIGYRGAQTSPAITVTPYLVDNTSGQDVFYPYVTPFTGLTETSATYTLGTQNYLFASSFTPDQINNMKIQLISNGDVYIDSFLVNVYYYIPGPSGSTPIPSSGCEDCNSPIQVQAMYLQLPFKIGETKFYLKPGSLTYPDGTPVQPGDVGTCGGEIDFVFDEGKAKSAGGNFEENVILDLYSNGWTVLPSGVIEVDIGSVTNRGIPFHSPFTHDATLMSDHDANSKVVISNNAHFESRFVRACQADSVFSVPISIKDEGVEETPSVHSMNFVGGGVQVTVPDPLNPNDVEISIPGVGGTISPSIVSTTSTTSGSTQVDEIESDLVITGLNRGAVIQIATEQLVTVTGVTVGGVAATQEATVTDAPNNLRSEAWVCVNPPLGTQPVVVTLSAPAYVSFGAECINNIDVSTPVGTTQTATGTGFTPTLNLNTTYDNSLVFDSLCTAQTPILFIPGAGQTLNWSEVANSVTRQGGSSVESAGLQPDTITMDYSITQNTPWALCAIEIKGITNTTGSGITSINGDTTAAQTIVAGSGINVATVAGVTTITNTGGGGTGTALETTVSQTGHGLSVGDVIKVSGTNTFAKAQANSEVNSEAVGVVTTVVNANSFKYVSSAIQLSYAPVGTPGSAVWLSPTVAGGMTTTKPSTIGQVARALGTIIESGAKMYFDIAALAEVIGSGGSSSMINNPTYFDDFLTVSGTLVGSLNFLSSLAVAGTDGQANHPGIVRLGSLPGGSAGSFTLPSSYPIPDIMNDGNEYQFIVKPEVIGALANYQIKIERDSSSGDITIKFDGATGDIQLTTFDGTTTTTTTVATYTLGNWYNFIVKINGASVELYQAGVLVATNTTNLPPAGIGNVVVATSNGAAGLVDYFAMKIANLTR